MSSRIQTEHSGVTAVAAAVAQVGWLFRELTGPDYGIDAVVELVDDEGRPNGRLIGIQIKSGSSYFSRARGAGWVYSISEGNLAYWATYSLPVILVLYRPDDGCAYWQAVTPATVQLNASGEGFEIVVPRGQPLDESATAALSGLANASEPVFAPVSHYLAASAAELRSEFDLPLLRILASGGEIALDAEEWINKSSGRASLKLTVTTAGRDQTEEREWPFVLVRGDFLHSVAQVFPWATLTVDEEIYAEHDYERYVDECGHWDREDGEYIFSESYSEWRARQATEVRPYAEVGGEVALWRLRLTLNDVGREVVNRDRQAEDEELLTALRSFIQADDEAERRRRARAEGHYAGEYVDHRPHGGTLELVAFWSRDGTTGEEEFTPIGSAPMLWSDGEGQDAARMILRDAMGGEPSDALTRAFAARFGAVFDDDGQGWVIRYDEVENWVREVRANPVR